VELPLIYSGTPSDERITRAKAALDAVDLGDRMNHNPMNFPVDSASAWPSRAPW